MDRQENQLMITSDFLQALKTDDRRMLYKLYADYSKRVESYVIKRGANREEAKDIAQESFLATWRSVQLGRFAPESAKHFAAYLLKVGQYMWADELAKRKGKHFVELQQEHALADEVEDVEDQRDTYIQALRQQYKNLGERCQDLLNRFYFKRQRLREIASFFGWTEASAKNNKYRCLKKLRDLLSS